MSREQAATRSKLLSAGHQIGSLKTKSRQAKSLARGRCSFFGGLFATDARTVLLNCQRGDDITVRATFNHTRASQRPGKQPCYRLAINNTERKFKSGAFIFFFLSEPSTLPSCLPSNPSSPPSDLSCLP